jgi:hypothetical protein
VYAGILFSVKDGSLLEITCRAGSESNPRTTIEKIGDLANTRVKRIVYDFWKSVLS